jgi:wyosine [tRNA(Phe)-imidazoG37] synthetase (radical SAM superfamily)
MHRAEKDLHGRMAGAWRRHERRWRENKYVYAVASRRSRGISIGINLNPGKGCNFGCLYCQVDRTTTPKLRRVDLKRISEELSVILTAEKDGSLYDDDRFQLMTQPERGIRDIAFSGDGEPTTYPRLEDAIRIAAEARRRFCLDSAKLVLITNAAFLDKPPVADALEILDQNNGEIWAKLDAGTEAYFRRVNCPNVSLQKITANILAASRIRPVVIQSLWFRLQEAAPAAGEIEAYCDRLNFLIAGGGRLRNVQLYTIARDPADASASRLSNAELDRIGAVVRSRVRVSVEVFYSAG